MAGRARGGARRHRRSRAGQRRHRHRVHRQAHQVASFHRGRRLGKCRDCAHLRCHNASTNIESCEPNTPWPTSPPRSATPRAR
ncbi:hypothetical protein [Lysobacter gummosus]|uniref:hypothetical protein n=1 Tax=Lysobacter gummosus TaxID=262324 RepID=UPI00363ECCF2